MHKGDLMPDASVTNMFRDCPSIDSELHENLHRPLEYNKSNVSIAEDAVALWITSRFRDLVRLCLVPFLLLALLSVSRIVRACGCFYRECLLTSRHCLTDSNWFMEFI